jgi:16S rRNA processing protein RimM
VNKLKETLNIGQIINTHGLKGELKIYPLTDDIRRFRKLKSVIIDDTVKNVTWCKIQNDKVIMKIEGIDSIEQAMLYKSKYLEIKREEAVKLPEGRYYVADILGCRVLDTDNLDLGKVHDVIFTKNNDVYWVKGNKELLIPVLDHIVVDINVEKKEIIIKPTKEWQDED